MPKIRPSTHIKLKQYVRDFGEEYFSTDGKIFFCKVCSVKVTAHKKFNVQQHCNTSKHKNSVSRNSSSEARQKLLSQKDAVPEASSVPEGRTSEFFKDLCEMMMSADIPLCKLNNPHFRDFLEKYTHRQIPNETTLRKTYVNTCYKGVLNKIRSRIDNHKIWISIDETIDVDRRCIANLVVGILGEDQPGESFLLSCELMEKTNHSTIALFFEDAMNLLWPTGVKRENVLLFITAPVPYMVKAAQGLKMLYPKMVHISCMARSLNRVTEDIRGKYPDVDKLISTTIAQLETDVGLCRSLELVKHVESEINVYIALGMVGGDAFARLHNILTQNEGYSTLCKIGDILNGNHPTFTEDEPEYTCDDITFFKFAPVTSCDVERSFTRYRSMLCDNRRSFKFENFKMFVVVYCNSGNENSIKIECQPELYGPELKL